MKILFIGIAAIISLFLLAQSYITRGQNDIESYPYTVVKEYDDFEIRNYEASLFSSVELDSESYSDASSEGFRKLAGYIFGANDRNEKIAMTSPVAMTLEGTKTMMFMIPRNFRRDELPEPNNSDIQFVQEEEKKVAAISFSGWADDQKIEKYRKKLVAALKEEGLSHSENFYFLGYNPPYEVINRRNEIIVEL